MNDPRFRVAMARRMLYRHGCDTGIAQHVSERCRDGNGSWVTALEHGDLTTPDSVARFDFENRMIERPDRSDPTLEFAPDYIEIYQCRPDVQAVVHTHSFWATVLCTTGDTIGAFNNIGCLLAGRQATWVDDRFDPESRGKRVADALGDRSVLLMRNHGVVVAAETLEVATVLACVVEDQARVHLEATARGGSEMVPERIAPMREGHERVYIGQTWAANVRRLRITDPDLFRHLDS